MGGGGGERFCALIAHLEREVPLQPVPGPAYKSPGSSVVLDALSCYLSRIFEVLLYKIGWNQSRSKFTGVRACYAPPGSVTGGGGGGGEAVHRVLHSKIYIRTKHDKCDMQHVKANSDKGFVPASQKTLGIFSNNKSRTRILFHEHGIQLRHYRQSKDNYARLAWAQASYDHLFVVSIVLFLLFYFSCWIVDICLQVTMSVSLFVSVVFCNLVFVSIIQCLSQYLRSRFYK